jgi:hypothetical protein
VDRGIEADLEVEALDRGTGRAEENCLTLSGLKSDEVGKNLSASEAQKEDEVHQ